MAKLISPLGLLKESARKSTHKRMMKSPALAKIEEERDEALSRAFSGLLQVRAGVLAGVLVPAFALLFAGMTVMPSQPVLGGGLMAAGYIWEFGGLAAQTNTRREWRLADALLKTIELLEEHPDRWQQLNLRRKINRQLGRAARAAEKVPLQRCVRRGTEAAILQEKARAIAASLRELKIWVVQPNPFTFTDLALRLSTSLITVLDGRWYNLPQAPSPPQPRSQQGMVFVVVIVATVAAAIAVVVFLEDQQGPLLTILLTVAVGVLAKVGVPTSSIGDAADVAKKLRKAD